MGQYTLAHIPINKRPRTSILSKLSGCVFIVLFNLSCISIQGTQWLFLPIRFISQDWWDACIRYTKHAFAISLIWMSQWFAPTEFSITTEGAYFENQSVFEKDSMGNITKINLPTHLIIISNHQVYLDWWYLWSFTYWTGGHKDVIIVLKKSLKWLPIVGWGMIWFRFIFLARSWAADSKYYINRLASLAELTKRRGQPLTFFLYPEGTLVSNDTRPLSKKWASKSGISDLRHILLPRTTGLHVALRSLAPRIPDLHLLDLTVAYEGIPRNAYGQSYFTLRSVFLDGVPPPRIHLHLKLYCVNPEVPIGEVDAFNEEAPPRSRKEDEISRVDAVHFEEWLLRIWRRKDDLIENFLVDGSFDGSKEILHVPVKLRSGWEAIHACLLVCIALILYLSKRIALNI